MVKQFEIDVYGRKVVLQELRTKQMEIAMRLGNVPNNVQATSYRTALEGIRHSLVSVDGRPFKHADVAGDLLSDVFTSREIVLLQAAWNQIHLPTGEEMEDVGNAMTAISGA